MGTRSLTKVYDQFGGGIISTMYCQYDGYPTGVGSEILNCLKGINVVNGINNLTPKPFVNRMGQLVTFLAKESGIKYEFQNPNDDGCDYIDFIYHLRFKDGHVHLTVESFGENIYEGMMDEFNPKKLEEEMQEDD